MRFSRQTAMPHKEQWCWQTAQSSYPSEPPFQRNGIPLPFALCRYHALRYLAITLHQKCTGRAGGCHRVPRGIVGRTVPSAINMNCVTPQSAFVSMHHHFICSLVAWVLSLSCRCPQKFGPAFVLSPLFVIFCIDALPKIRNSYRVSFSHARYLE